MKLKLNIKRLDPDAKIPNYAHVGDAGLDLYTPKEVTIAPGERAMMPTGISLAVPHGYVGLVWEKSGLSMKHGLVTLGGVIDAGYRGEITVGIANISKESYTFKAGEKIAQMLIQKIEHVSIEETDELDATPRGHGGFGSTGK